MRNKKRSSAKLRKEAIAKLMKTGRYSKSWDIPSASFRSATDRFKTNVPVTAKATVLGPVSTFEIKDKDNLSFFLRRERKIEFLGPKKQVPSPNMYVVENETLGKKAMELRRLSDSRALNAMLQQGKAKKVSSRPSSEKASANRITRKYRVKSTPKVHSPAMPISSSRKEENSPGKPVGSRSAGNSPTERVNLPMNPGRDVKKPVKNLKKPVKNVKKPSRKERTKKKTDVNRMKKSAKAKATQAKKIPGHRIETIPNHNPSPGDYNLPDPWKKPNPWKTLPIPNGLGHGERFKPDPSSPGPVTKVPSTFSEASKKRPASASYLSTGKRFSSSKSQSPGFLYSSLYPNESISTPKKG